METGLIGLPLSGKTTIFNTLTGKNAATSAYSGGKKEMNIAEINVPDTRVDDMTKLFKPKKTVYATVVFKDLQIEFNDQGGITPASIADIRNLTALAVIIRAFQNEAVPHPFEKVDPAADLKKIIDSLIFSDYEMIEKRMQRLEKEAKKATREYQILEKLAEKLMGGELIGEEMLSEEDLKLFAGFSFITNKPIIVTANLGEKSADLSGLEKMVKDYRITLFPLRGDIEMEISQLAKEDQKDFLADLGLTEPAMDRFLLYIYKTLNLISFLTVGEDEVRAWSIKKGSNAQKAAGRIHSDLERGFIRAEVVSYTDLNQAGNYAEAKKTGKQRLEGKEYIVQDGDVMNILFNV
jgi:ribosome-binding ATPase